MPTYKDSYDAIRAEIGKHEDDRIDLTVLMSRVELRQAFVYLFSLKPDGSVLTEKRSMTSAPIPWV